MTIAPATRSALLALALLTATTVARAADGSAGETASGSSAPAKSAASSPVVAAGIWTVAQLIPSPLLVIGSAHVGGGVRWQITPLVYSFGVASRPFRAFVIEPVARHSGGIELYASPEWACCALGGGTGWIARAGGRVYLPLIGHGEALAWSFGSSYYRARGGAGAAFEVGAYVLFGIAGVTVTVSPALASREVITALTLRYF